MIMIGKDVQGSKLDLSIFMEELRIIGVLPEV
jgi:hypothetical protein